MIKIPCLFRKHKNVIKHPWIALAYFTKSFCSFLLKWIQQKREVSHRQNEAVSLFQNILEQLLKHSAAIVLGQIPEDFQNNYLTSI